MILEESKHLNLMVTNFDFVKKKVTSGSLFYITFPILLFMKNGPAFWAAAITFVRRDFKTRTGLSGDSIAVMTEPPRNIAVNRVLQIDFVSLM